MCVCDRGRFAFLILLNSGRNFENLMPPFFFCLDTKADSSSSSFDLDVVLSFFLFTLLCENACEILDWELVWRTREQRWAVRD